jgi:hypothetical protein
MAEQKNIYHEVRTINSHRADKEVVTITFSTVWRKTPVTVDMNASRYTYSGGNWSEWRIYAERAREGVSGSGVTDLARSRLGDELRPLVAEWIASPAYADSRRGAFVDALKRIAGDLSKYYGGDTLRRAVAASAEEIGPDDVAHFDAIAAAFDQYVALLNGAER